MHISSSYTLLSYLNPAGHQGSKYSLLFLYVRENTVTELRVLLLYSLAVFVL